METLHIVTIIDDETLEHQLSTMIHEAMSEEVNIISFRSITEAVNGLGRLDQNQRNDIALLILNFCQQNEFADMLLDLYEKNIPDCRKMLILKSEDASQVMQLTNRVSFDKFLVQPLLLPSLLQTIELMIEQFLEHKILRRSLTEVRQTYEAMKEQYQALQEANLSLDRKIMELSTLSEIGRDLMSTYNQDDIFRGTVLTLMGQKGSSSVILFSLNEHNKRLEVKVHRGIPEKHPCLSLTIPATSPLLNDLFRESKPNFVRTLTESPENLHEFGPLADLGLEIFIPLLNKGVRKGFVLLGPKVNTNHYSNDDFEFFSILANQMIFALDNAQLYMKLEAKITELEQANRELRQLDRMKSEFITIASHELRTPLTAIRGYTELLLAGKFNALSQQQAKAIEIVNKNVDRLIKISEDVVQLSKLDADRLSINFVPSALERIITDIVEEMTPIAHTRNIAIVFEQTGDFPFVMVDVGLLNQAIIELIKNAIRFTPDGGTISLSCATITAAEIPAQYLPEAARDNYLKMMIRDDGIGIPKEEYDRIFERFYEVQHSDFHHSGLYEFKSGGTGLGLAVVKSIISKHGGSIWVTSGLEQGLAGSEFSFVLPIPVFKDAP